jgi:general stress protein 26
MTWLPDAVVELLEAALVTELSVVRSDGRPVTYPLIPMWDGEKVLMTSSILFSRKLEHLKANPRVSLALSDPTALGGLPARATILGDAAVIDGDPHADWERVLPLWARKEPLILELLKSRVAFPLFFERAVIEVTPRRVLLWRDGDTSREPEITAAPSTASLLVTPAPMPTTAPTPADTAEVR